MAPLDVYTDHTDGCRIDRQGHRSPQIAASFRHVLRIDTMNNFRSQAPGKDLMCHTSKTIEEFVLPAPKRVDHSLSGSVMDMRPPPATC